MRIGYARVSTTDQRLDLQLDALEKAGCEKVYSEKMTGATVKGRSELENCLKALREGDSLVVWKLDRLGRNLGEIASLMTELERSGVSLLSLSDNIDTSGPMGKAFAHLALVFAELERDRIRERTKAGLVAARARGRKGGRPAALTPEQISQVQILMRDPQVSPKQVADQYGVSRSTLYRYAPKSLAPQPVQQDLVNGLVGGNE